MSAVATVCSFGLTQLSTGPGALGSAMPRLSVATQRPVLMEKTLTLSSARGVGGTRSLAVVTTNVASHTTWEVASGSVLWALITSVSSYESSAASRTRQPNSFLSLMVKNSSSFIGCGTTFATAPYGLVW